MVAGAALPLLDLTGTLSGSAGWGYLSLLLGAACMACDRYFGLTSGWIRNLATAQAVQRRLQVLQFDWASECVREMLGPTEGTASEAESAVPGGAAEVLRGRHGAGAVGDGGLDGGVPGGTRADGDQALGGGERGRAGGAGGGAGAVLDAVGGGAADGPQRQRPPESPPPSGVPGACPGGLRRAPGPRSPDELDSGA
ncbi:hypothetical protein SBADM41S_01996 [Streptomyces badius]